MLYQTAGQHGYPHTQPRVTHIDRGTLVSVQGGLGEWGGRQLMRVVEGRVHAWRSWVWTADCQ